MTPTRTPTSRGPVLIYSDVGQEHHADCDGCEYQEGDTGRKAVAKISIGPPWQRTDLHLCGLCLGTLHAGLTTFTGGV